MDMFMVFEIWKPNLYYLSLSLYLVRIQLGICILSSNP